MHERRLPSTRTDVTRVGDTVLRSVGPWTPAVHALLRHLETVGFRGAPRVIGDGYDDAGRERLSFLEGAPVHPHSWTDDGIAELGTMLRKLHDATVGFEPPTGAAWQPWFTRPAAKTDGDLAFGHGDLEGVFLHLAGTVVSEDEIADLGAIDEEMPQ